MISYSIQMYFGDVQDYLKMTGLHQLFPRVFEHIKDPTQPVVDIASPEVDGKKHKDVCVCVCVLVCLHVCVCVCVLFVCVYICVCSVVCGACMLV